MYLFTATSIISFITAFSIGVIFLLKGKDRKVATLLGLTCIASSLWEVGAYKFSTASSRETALFWIKFAHIGIILTPTFFFHFACQWTKNYKKVLIALVYSLALLFIGYSFFYKEFFGLQFVFNQFYFFHCNVAKNPAYLVFYLGFYWIFLIYAFFLLIRHLRSSSGILYTQIRYFIIGVIVAWLGPEGMFLLVFGMPLYPYSNILIGVYPLIFAYAILKHHLMDIRVVAARTTIFLLVYILVLGLPFWFGYKTGLWVWAVGLMGVLASAGPFIYNYFRKKAENILLHEQNRYQKALKDFSSTLIFIRDTEELSEKIVIKIMDAVNLDFCVVYLKQDREFSLRSKKITNHPQLPDKIKIDSEFSQIFNGSNAPRLGEFIPALDGVKIGLACPLFLNQNLYGFIILGHKEKGALFTDTDIDAFSIVSNQVSLALSEIYYFNEFQKATEEKYKLLVEKERLQSAFEIAEAYRHELGNILNIISTSLANLMFIGNTVPTKEDIEKTRKSINENVKRGHRIFDAINKYNENSPTEPKPARLDELLKATIDEKQEDITKNNIELRVDIDKNINISANENLIFALRYFLEGAIGAIDYTKPKTRIIDIKLKNQDNSAQLTISDTGGDATTDKLYSGIGIERAKEGGILYFIARRIIFDHQGKLEMVSFDNGKGTTFLIELPLAKLS